MKINKFWVFFLHQTKWNVKGIILKWSLTKLNTYDIMTAELQDQFQGLLLAMLWNKNEKHILIYSIFWIFQTGESDDVHALKLSRISPGGGSANQEIKKSGLSLKKA